MDVTPDYLMLPPGDTGRFSSLALTADGDRVSVRWTGTSDFAKVDSSGLVTALVEGRTFASASAPDEVRTRLNAGVWVVNTKENEQPVITSIRNAATGETMFRRGGFVGVDSIDVTVSYLQGSNAPQEAAATLIFQVRSITSNEPLSSVTSPLGVRGKIGKTTLRVRLTEKNASGTRRFPAGFYDFFVLMRLEDGSNPGDRTGYRVYW